MRSTRLAGDASKKRVTKDEKRNKIPEKWQRKGCITWEDLKGLVEDLGEQVGGEVLVASCGALLDRAKLKGRTVEGIGLEKY